MPRDGWPSPVELGGDGAAATRSAERRASDKGFLPLKLEQYLELLDWTGRQARPDKRGQIPAELLPILERLRLSSETWVDTVLNFGRWFRLAAGRVESLTAEAASRASLAAGGQSQPGRVCVADAYATPRESIVLLLRRVPGAVAMFLAVSPVGSLAAPDCRLILAVWASWPRILCRWNL